MPLILSRKRGETLVIDGPCLIRFLECRTSGNRVTVEITANQSVNVRRGELLDNQPTEPLRGRPLRTPRGKWRYPKRSDE